MATIKKTTVNKNESATTKKAATKKAAPKSAQVTTQGTRVVCPECGAEFDILADHQHMGTGLVLGKDSNLGTVYLPVSKRGDALKVAGIDPDKYFSIKLPTGGEQLMQMDESGRAVPVSADDPVISRIIAAGTVPNRNLFRRWVMALVFRGLSEKDSRGRVIGFTEWMKRHGYEYQWKQLIEELHTQTKLYGKDPENFEARNRWFNKDVAVRMAEDYISQMLANAAKRPTRKCKGVPYILVKGFGQGVFVDDVEKKLAAPLRSILYDIKTAKRPVDLELAVRCFWKEAAGKEWCYTQCAAWKDAYKGAGSYFTMQNLLRFHGCTFPKDNDFYERGLSGLQMLERAAAAYEREGWRLFGLLKQMIEYNGIDIERKREQWRQAKHARLGKQ